MTFRSYQVRWTFRCSCCEKMLPRTSPEYRTLAEAMRCMAGTLDLWPDIGILEIWEIYNDVVERREERLIRV